MWQEQDWLVEASEDRQDVAKFLHIPSHGDVKVVVCDKHRVIRLNIYYIAQQLEFSVKDLRSRLTKPESSLLPAEEQELLGSEEQRPEEKDPLPDMVACAHFSEECETKLQTRIKVFIKSFVFSLQTDSRENDYLKTEVCNIYADDLMAIYDDDDDQRELSLQLPNLQVDNQLYSNGKYDFPVLLCAEKLYRRNCALPQVYDLDAVYKLQAQRAPVSLFTFVFYQDEMQLQSVRCQIPRSASTLKTPTSTSCWRHSWSASPPIVCIVPLRSREDPAVRRASPPSRPGRGPIPVHIGAPAPQ